MIELTRVIKKWFTIHCDNCNEETELFLLRIAKSSSFLCQKCLDEIKQEIEAAQILAYKDKDNT